MEDHCNMLYGSSNRHQMLPCCVGVRLFAEAPHDHRCSRSITAALSPAATEQLAVQASLVCCDDRTLEPNSY